MTISGLAIVASFLYLDLRAANLFNQQELQRIYYYSREITNIGYSIHYFLLALLCLLFSKFIYPRSNYFQSKISIYRNDRLLKWSIFSMKSFFLIGVGLNILKYIIGRLRPHASPDFENMNFEMFNFHSHWHSFPSGHSQVLFTAATLALLIWPKFRYLFLFLAGLLAMTRITIHQHFLSDMIAGALIGHLATLWLYFYWPHRIDSIKHA